MYSDAIYINLLPKKLSKNRGNQDCKKKDSVPGE